MVSSSPRGSKYDLVNHRVMKVMNADDAVRYAAVRMRCAGSFSEVLRIKRLVSHLMDGLISIEEFLAQLG